MGNVKHFVAVVDDDESVGRAIKRMLRSVGIGADTFVSGDDFPDRFVSTPSYRPKGVGLCNEPELIYLINGLP